MPTINYTTVLLDRAKTIGAFAAAGLVGALLLCVVQPLKHSSTVRLLVMQDLGSTTDAYTASRSEERIAENLSTRIYTTTFFDEVMGSGFSIQEKYFPSKDYKRRQEWAKTVDATISRGSGLLTVTAYHQEVAQAEQIARAVASVLTEKADEYTSGGGVQVSLIDAPLNSRWPVKPNILANAVSGAVLGGLVGMGFVLTHYEKIRRRHTLAREDYHS